MLYTLPECRESRWLYAFHIVYVIHSAECMMPQWQAYALSVNLLFGIGHKYVYVCECVFSTSSSSSSKLSEFKFQYMSEIFTRVFMCVRVNFSVDFVYAACIL